MKFVIIIIIFFFTSLSANSKPMTMVDLLNVPSVSGGQLSPNGESIIYVKINSSWEENTNISSIWQANVNGGSPRQLTTNATNAISPEWSPDGKSILFISNRANDDNWQIYLLSISGGEAIQLTSHVTSVSSAHWSKNGDEIFFLAPDAKNEEQIKREEQKDDIFKFEQDHLQKHLWKITLTNKHEQRITEGDFSVTNYKISQNGNKIVHHRAPNPLLDAALDSEIWIMADNGKAAKRITNNKNPENGAELSPDNRSILYIAWTDENDQPYFENNLFIIPASGNGKSVQIFGSFDHDIQQAHWSEDGETIYFKANLGVHNELFHYNIKEGEISQLTDGKHTIVGWDYSPKRDSHIMSVRTAHNNGDFWYLKSNNNGSLTKITDIFGDLARTYDLPNQDVVRWKGADGVDVEGMIIYPNGYRKRNKYPLVVQTHGGPRSSDQWGIYNATSYATVLASNGYVILRPNYRGSLGYGDAFVRDMVGSYFNQSHLDVMTGVDHLIAEDIVDGDKMAKMGYSAGGHMTNKIITYTDRFKAASSSAGTVNWISMYSQSDTRIYRTPWFGGTPWQENAPIDTYWDNSPLKDISNVTTPTMIMVGGADVRVPKQQSIELYRALKSNGVETTLYIVPREQHGWKELRHKLNKMNLEMTWFEKYVKGREFEWEKIPSVLPPQ